MSVTPTITTVKNSYLLTESPELQFEYFTAKDLKKFKKDTRESLGSIQYNKWTDKNTTINIDVIDPKGKSIPIKTKFGKLREGKFDISLSSLMHGTPGIYKVKIILIKDGKTYSSESQFAWGLVTLNTDRSIYKPGEIANFTITTLLNNGTSACNSDILMKITDPNTHSTVLSSGKEITTSSFDCAIYQTQYRPSTEGNYTVDITAKTPSGISNFSTYFLVQKNYNYEIIRTTATKIDPFDLPNNFNVKLKIHSYVGSDPITINEYVPSVLNVTTDGSVSQMGDAKMITWVRNLDSNNDTIVSYDYAVPLVQPQLYALGKAQIVQNNVVTFTEARNWFVAVDATVTITWHLSPSSMETDSNIGTNSPISECKTTGCTVAVCTLSSVAAGTCSQAKNNGVTVTWSFASPVTTTSNYQYVFSSASGCTSAGQTGTNVAQSSTCTMTGTYQKQVTQSQSESTTITDQPVKTTLTLSKSQEESVTISDQPVKVSSTLSKSQEESVTISDNIKVSSTLSRAQEESVTLADNVKVGKTVSRAQEESVTISDQHVKET
jgi:hypothetical protein